MHRSDLKIRWSPWTRARSLAKSFALFAGLVCAAVLLSACGLTSSEREAIKAFGSLAGEFADVPSSVVSDSALSQARSRAFRDGAQLAATPEARPPGTAERLERYAGDVRKGRSRAAQLEKSLKPLGDYALQLRKIAEADTIEKLRKASTKLGKDLDSAAEDVNEVWREDAEAASRVDASGASNDGADGSLPLRQLPLIGDVVGGIVNFVGSIYIRYDQKRVLTRAVADADPHVAGICDEMVELLRVHREANDPAATGSPLHHAQLALDGLRDAETPKTAATAATYLDLFDLRLAAHAVKRSAERGQAAARKIKAAHSKLKVALEDSASFAELIELTRQLYDDVKAARKAARTIKKARDDE